MASSSTLPISTAKAKDRAIQSAIRFSLVKAIQTLSLNTTDTQAFEGAKNVSEKDDFKSYMAISTQAILGTAGDLAIGLHYPTEEYFSLTLSGAKRAVSALRKHANDLEGAIVRVENTGNSEEPDHE